MFNEFYLSRHGQGSIKHGIIFWGHDAYIFYESNNSGSFYTQIVFIYVLKLLCSILCTVKLGLISNILCLVFRKHMKFRLHSEF